jgi:hypothetical protein
MTTVRITYLLACGCVVLGACIGREADPASDSARGQDSTDATASACYRDSASVMGRTTPLTGSASPAPGWIRLDNPSRTDSGAALLIDGDGAAMPASWRRTAPDSIRIRAFDDFLQVSLDVAWSDASLNGTGLATSDAELVRDSTGRMRDLRREWIVAARTTTCAALPQPAGGGG